MLVLPRRHALHLAGAAALATGVGRVPAQAADKVVTIGMSFPLTGSLALQAGIARDAALFAIDDEALFLYRHQHKAFHPFRVHDDGVAEFAPIVSALKLIRRLHSRRNYRPVADTITELLTATRAVDPLPLIKTKTAVSTRAPPTMSHNRRPNAVVIASSLCQA